MKKIYKEIELDEQSLSCSNCGWKGKGSDAIIIDLYGVTDVQEIHCPECDEYIAGLKITGS